MTKQKLQCVAFLAGSFASISLDGSLRATTCIESSRLEAFKSAAIVFRGKVVRVEDTTPEVDAIDKKTGKLSLQPATPGGPRIVTLTVSRVWKGPHSSTLQLFVFEHPSLGSGFHFLINSDYVVYATDDIRQDWREIRQFSKRSRVFGIGMPCVLRIRTDVGPESEALNRLNPQK